MAAKTLYELLGVPRNATPGAIKDAYVKNGGRLRSAGAAADAQVLKQAYEVLSDPKLRARYDQQAYTVSDSSSPAPEEDGGRHWLFTRRGAVAALGVVLIAFFAWSYHKREQERIRFENQQVEARRLADEQRRYEEQRQKEAERRTAEERQRAAIDNAAAQRANQTSRGETLYRDTLQHQRTLQSDRLQLQRDRDAARREDAERRRQELEARRQIERDKRLARELDATSPRRF